MRIGDYSIEITDTNMVLRDPAGDELVIQPLSLDIVDGLKEIVSKIVEQYGPEEVAPEMDVGLEEPIEEEPGEIELDLDLDFEPEGEVKRNGNEDDEVAPTPPGEQLTEEQEAMPNKNPESQVVTGYLSSVKVSNFHQIRYEIADDLERMIGADQNALAVVHEYKVMVNEMLQAGRTPHEIATLLASVVRG